MLESINWFDKRSVIKEIEQEPQEHEIDNLSSCYNRIRNVTYICPKCGLKTRTYIIKVNYNLELFSTEEDRLDISNDISYLLSKE